MSALVEDAVTATSGRAKRGRPRRRMRVSQEVGQSVEGQRYFVAKPSGRRGTLTLDREVASEAEALIAAFKGDSRVFVVTEYAVAEKLQGTMVMLVKELAPLDSGSRVSTTNES